MPMKTTPLLDPEMMRGSALFQDFVERLRTQLPDDHPLLAHLDEITGQDKGPAERE